jgi:hypothetical protein
MEECRLCLDPLDGTQTRYEHPLNGTCTGFNLHAACLADYIDKYLTQHTNLVCLRCKLDLSPFHNSERRTAEQERQRLIRILQQRLVQGEERVRLLRERLERAERAENPFRHLPIFTDIIHGVVAGHTFIRIVTNRPDYTDLATLGLCTIYAYSRTAPYLRRVIRGGTRKRGRKGGANQLVIIDVRHPTQALLHELEDKLGKSHRLL